MFQTSFVDILLNYINSRFQKFFKAWNNKKYQAFNWKEKDY